VTASPAIQSSMPKSINNSSNSNGSPSLSSILAASNLNNKRGRSRTKHTNRIPMVYLRCGHVHGQHDWGIRTKSSGPLKNQSTSSTTSTEKPKESSSLDFCNDLDLRECPLCRKIGPYVKLIMGLEPSFYFDPMTINISTHTGSTKLVTNYFKPYAFVPCGHMASELACKYWSRIRVPQGTTQGLHSTCPFCSKKLDVQQPFIKLIFQEGS
jgi:pellino protein